MKTIKKIVLTGGPCAGKTSALSRIFNKLSEMNYKVLIIPETATEIKTSGVSIDNTGLTGFNFQTAILKMQIQKERLYEEIASMVNSEKVIIVCDRGCLDGKAYCSDKEYSDLLRNLKLAETILRDEYDAVFHLKTAADGAEQFYTLENNSARTEGIEEAKEVDLKTIKAWTGHHYLRIIDNSTDFDTKMDRLMIEILKFLGEPIPIQTERRFLVEIPDMALMKALGAVKIDIVQTYLKTNNKEEEKRILQRGNNGDYVYFLTTKRTINDSSRIKLEKRISYKEYLDSLVDIDTKLRLIRKERYCFIYNNIYYRFDLFPFWDNKGILEVEPTEEMKDIKIPDFIKGIKDITGEKKYKNYFMAKKIPV